MYELLPIIRRARRPLLPVDPAPMAPVVPVQVLAERAETVPAVVPVNTETLKSNGKSAKKKSGDAA